MPVVLSGTQEEIPFRVPTATLPITAMEDAQVKALLKLNNSPDRTSNLKRLALLFDQILYLLPETHPILDGELLDDGRIRRTRIDGTASEEEFNFFLHTSPGLVFDEGSIHDAELQETLAELRENGIARQTAFDNSSVFGSSEFRTVRNALAVSDLCDETFRRLSETTADQCDRLKLTALDLVDENGRRVRDVLVRAPNAIVDSYDLTDVLVLAHENECCPVFIDPCHRRELQHRYSNARSPDESVLRAFPKLDSRSETKTIFGAVAFTLASEVFDSTTVVRKKTSEIIRYRNCMADARRLYISSDLIDLTKLVESSPWDDKVRCDIELYVMGKLKHDVALYRTAMQETWEKMFGTLGTSLAAGLAAGGAGGIIGHLLPHCSLWEMALIGSVGGIIKEFPRMAQSVVDSILAARAKRRSAIAYVADFH